MRGLCAFPSRTELEYGRKRTGACPPAARSGRPAHCRPDRLEPDPLRLSLRPANCFRPLADPQALDYDPQPLGSLRRAQAVCDYYAEHGVALDPGQIVLTASTSEAYSFLFRLLCDPGSEILVPQPGYPLFDFLAVLDDVRIRPVSLVYDQGWQIEPEGFRRAITPETRAIVLVHPNNPTGHFTKPWEAEELARLCREFDLSLIVDEVFLDYGISATGRSFAAGLGRRARLRGERAEQDRRIAADEGIVDCGHGAGADGRLWNGWR